MFRNKVVAACAFVWETGVKLKSREKEERQRTRLTIVVDSFLVFAILVILIVFTKQDRKFKGEIRTKKQLLSSWTF
jgi:hypothetical protein